jgi:hypothetical protein
VAVEEAAKGWRLSGRRSGPDAGRDEYEVRERLERGVAMSSAF